MNNEQKTSIRWNQFHRSAGDSLYRPEAVWHYHMVMVVGAVSAVDIGDIMGDFSDHRITCGRMKKWTQLNSLKSMIGCANHLAAIAGRSTGSRRWRTMAIKIIKPGRPGEIKRFTCSRCGCVFEADKDDYEKEHILCNGYYLKIDCPCCGYTIRKSCDE